MEYDVKIGNIYRREISYAELVSLPLRPESLVRRSNSDWMTAAECVELSHIICSCSPDGEADIHDPDNSGTRQAQGNVSRYPRETAHAYVQPHGRIFIPTAEYFKCKQKRKAAIIGVCTLGLAALTLYGVGNTWRGNIFKGMSFTSHAGMGFVFQCLSFIILTTLMAIPYFIYSVFALVYYSIRLRNLKR